MEYSGKSGIKTFFMMSVFRIVLLLQHYINLSYSPNIAVATQQNGGAEKPPATNCRQNPLIKNVSVLMVLNDQEID